MGTMVWLIAFNILEVIYVFYGNKMCKRANKHTKSRSYFKEQYNSLFFNGILDTVASMDLTLIIFAII